MSTTLEFKKKKLLKKKGIAQINGKLQMGEKKKKRKVCWSAETDFEYKDVMAERNNDPPFSLSLFSKMAMLGN